MDNKSSSTQTRSNYFSLFSTLGYMSGYVWLLSILVFGMLVYMSKGLTSYPSVIGEAYGFVAITGIATFLISCICFAIASKLKKDPSTAYSVGKKVQILVLATIIATALLSITQSVIKANIASTPPITKSSSQLQLNASIKPKPSIKGSTNTNQGSFLCTGPDLKQFKTSEAECAKFRQAWGLPAANNPLATTTPQGVSTPKQPLCYVYYSAFKFTATYQTFTPEQCAAAQRAAISNTTSTPYPTVAPSYSPTTLPTPQPTPNNQEICSEGLIDWNSYKESFMANQYNNYSSSAEAMYALIAEKQRYQSTMDRLNCGITLR